MDPYERADVTSNTYHDWMIDHMFICVPAQAVVGQFLSTFQEFPPSQKAGGASASTKLWSCYSKARAAGNALLVNVQDA